MKRRRFLTIAGIGTAVAAVVSGKFFLTTFETSVESVIKNELGFLTLDESGVQKFARDYAAIKDRNYKLIVKGYSILHVSASRSGKIHQLVSTYLLSTDFFANKMDERRLIKYVGLYDPYLRPCAHPFTNA